MSFSRLSVIQTSLFMTAQAGKAPVPGITTPNGTRLLKRMRARMTVH
jgi:hypothetical protein